VITGIGVVVGAGVVKKVKRIKVFLSVSGHRLKIDVVDGTVHTREQKLDVGDFEIVGKHLCDQLFSLFLQ